MAKYHIKDMNETVERGEYETLLEGNMASMYNIKKTTQEGEVLEEGVKDVAKRAGKAIKKALVGKGKRGPVRKKESKLKKLKDKVTMKKTRDELKRKKAAKKIKGTDNPATAGGTKKRKISKKHLVGAGVIGSSGAAGYAAGKYVGTKDK